MRALRAHDLQPPPPPSGLLVDINELSRRLSIPKSTLYNWCYLKRIPFVKAGRSLRFDPMEVIQSLPHYAMIGSADQRWKGH